MSIQQKIGFDIVKKKLFFLLSEMLYKQHIKKIFPYSNKYLNKYMHIFYLMLYIFLLYVNSNTQKFIKLSCEHFLLVTDQNVRI